MSPYVLVVEDYADLRSAIVAALVRSHYDCDSAGSSEDAIVKLQKHDYAAILIAPKLPITDDPVMHYIAENRPDDMRKVIVMCDPATATPGCVQLEKPFTNSTLLARLEERLKE